MKEESYLYHWYDEPSDVRLKLDNSFRLEVLQKALRKSDGAYKLAKVLGCCPQTVYNYINGVSMTVGFLKKLLTYVDFSFNVAEKHVTELAWMKKPNIPFEMSTASGAVLLGAFLSDGSNTPTPMYKNSEFCMRRKIEKHLRLVFGKNVIVRNDTSTSGVPLINTSHIVNRVLHKFGAVRGRKVKINPPIPDVVWYGEMSVKSSYFRQVFDDEGEVNVPTRKVILTRAVEVTRFLPEEFVSKLEIGKFYGVGCIQSEIKCPLYENPPNLLVGESTVLSDLGIMNKLSLRKIILQKSGYVTAVWNLKIAGKENLEKFRASIGFTISSKNEALTRLVSSYVKKRRTDDYPYRQILAVAETNMKEKGFFKLGDITSATRLSYNSVKKRVNRLKRLNKVAMFEFGKYRIDGNAGIGLGGKA